MNLFRMFHCSTKYKILPVERCTSRGDDREGEKQWIEMIEIHNEAIFTATLNQIQSAPSTVV